MKMPEGVNGLRKLRGAAYWPGPALIVLLVLVATLLPDAPNVRPAQQLTGGSDDGDVNPALATPATTGGPATDTSAAERVTRGDALTPGGATQDAQPGALAPDCDPKTGRLKIPILGAPACLPLFTGDNGGNTYQGVTAKEIKIAYYVAPADPAVDAILNAAGANDTPEQTAETIANYIDLFEKHFETYGRKVKWVRVDGSGPGTDDQAAKADAIKVAEQIKAFASVGAANNTYVDELVARKVMCFCTVQLPLKFYERWKPYVWGALPAYEQMAAHMSEYIGKRLKGRPARWAGDPAMRTQQRKYGLIAVNSVNGDYNEGIEYFQTVMKRQGTPIVETVQFQLDLARAQEQSRTMIAKLKAKGVTSVIMSVDPVYPIFITQEATRQRFFPEWLITGTALSDTNFFGRTYDQQQWSHAFGISPLAVRLPVEQGDGYAMHIWHTGKPPPAAAGHTLIWPAILGLYTGIHNAGPHLTPQSWRDGLFKLDPFPSNAAGGTRVTVSYGRHVWPYDDFMSIDDMTEIWWDPDAVGRDEIGGDGRGMVRFVAGGQRYLPGHWPTAESSAFNPKGAVTGYSKRPPEDTPPSYPGYPHKKWYRPPGCAKGCGP